MGDQARQQANAAGAGAEEAPAAPSAAWASFMSSFQQQAYVSPGARATGRRAGAHKGATPRASRMQPSSAAAAAGAGAAWPGPAAASAAGAAAPPMFAFGSPMQQAGSAGTAPAQAAGNTPVPSTLPPGTAMSTDTAMPADFTAAFSAMSVDAATPAVGSGSSSQPWAFRGPRAAAVTGKRLFDTPSTAGADSSTPSPFGSWGRGNAAGEGGSAQQACGGSNRAGAGPVPFTGFGSTVNQDTAAAAAATGSASPASGSFSFNQGGCVAAHGAPWGHGTTAQRKR
jgi:hypothetical protein